MPDSYLTIEKPSYAEFKDRGSSFLAYAFPLQTVQDFKTRLKELKNEHPKAAHHCFAYRIGTDGNNFRTGDDGEPAGSAGKPILGQIDSRQVCDVSIIVVRYFGGTLLGVPGLINAYKTVSSFALQLTPIIEKPLLVQYQLQFDYTLMNEVMMIVKKYHCTIIQNEAMLFCDMILEIPKASLKMCLQKFTDLNRVTATLYEKIK